MVVIATKEVSVTRLPKPVGRNSPCPCGSGRKYKKCCLEKDARRLRKERETAASGAQQAP